MSQLKTEFDEAIGQLLAPGAPYEVAAGVDSVRYYVNAPRTLPEALWVARDHGDREFLVYEGERRTFNQLLDEADAIAAALQAKGLGRGDRIALAMRNYPEWMAAFLAISRVGAVIVPLNSWGQPEDIAFTVEDAGARLVFCDQQRFNGIAARLAEKGIDCIIARPDNADDPDGLDAFTAQYAKAAPEPVEIAQDDLALIM